tara:strand:- start:5795 stop:6193 length:399 start_codon:yes stop_codon:yes gene_type:complete
MGLGPLAHPEINARLSEADKTKRYMIAVWSVVDDPEGEVGDAGSVVRKVNFSMLSNKFPSMDLPKAEEQFNDSISDFQLQIIKAADSGVIQEAPPVTEEEMKSRPSGVVTMKTPKPIIPPQEVPPPLEEKEG